MCNLSSVQFVLLMCLLSVALAQWVTPSSVAASCTTPTGSNGQCINLRSCSPLLQLLQNAPKPLSQENIQLLRQSQCGFEGHQQPKVCCPSAAPLTNSGGDDVTSHTNYRLLPHDTCGAQLEDRIFGGNKTGLFEFPWMALLAYRSRNGDVSFRCGGSLITDRYVLTAAHCLLTEAKGFTIQSVRLGEHNTDTKEDCELQDDNTTQCADPPQDIDVAEVIMHPEYNRIKSYNDIALLRLASPADLRSDSVRPVCLPVMADLRAKDLTSRSAVVSGWGYTESGRKSAELLKVDLPVVSNEQCDTVYGKRTNILPTQLCAGGTEGKDSCGGDSGGPLKLPGKYGTSTRMIQYGIVSFGPVSCGSQGVPGVYTRVTHYVDWILDNMKP